MTLNLHKISLNMKKNALEKEPYKYRPDPKQVEQDDIIEDRAMAPWIDKLDRDEISDEEYKREVDLIFDQLNKSLPSRRQWNKVEQMVRDVNTPTETLKEIFNEVSDLPGYLALFGQNPNVITDPEFMALVDKADFEFCLDTYKKYLTGEIAGWGGADFSRSLKERAVRELADEGRGGEIIYDNPYGPVPGIPLIDDDDNGEDDEFDLPENLPPGIASKLNMKKRMV